ncbi:MAG: hypothetical protein ACREHD_17755, partial [Pirellulales bacterium]
MGKVVTAQTTQVSQDAASVVSTGNQEITETSNLANEEILAAAGEVWQEALAYVADSLTYAVAEGGRYAAYVTDATTWLNTVIPAAVGDQQTLNTDASSLTGQAQTALDGAAHQVHTAQQTFTNNLISPGQTLIHALSIAKKIYVIAVITQEAADANTEAQNNANDIQNQPDQNFAGEEPGASGMLFMGQPPQGEVPTMIDLQQPVQPTKAEQILLDRCTTLQNLLTEAQNILGEKSPELTAIIAAAYNSANNLSITTKWSTYPFGQGRPHCADYAGAIKSGAFGVQQSKYKLENLAFTYTGNHGTMVTDEATGKSIFIYVSPVIFNFWTYSYGLDGKVFGPTMHIVDGDEQRLEDAERKQYKDLKEGKYINPG